MATNTFTALDKVTVGTATSSITFSSIPSTYTDLVVVASILPSSTSFYTPSLQFNSDTGSNYSSTWMYGQGTTAVSSRNVSQTQMAIDNYAATPAVGYPMTVNFSVMNYSNTTTYKTVLARGNDIFASAGETSATVGVWRSTSAITSVTVKGNGANFAVGSTFSLYGIASAQVGAKATGGIVTSDSLYYYHTFSASGTFTPTQSITADCLVVGGGGGGGGYTFISSGGSGGAGGGAGGLLGFASQSLTATGYTVTVGAGGAGGNGASGSTGSDSQFGALTLVKGGGFGGGNAANGTSVAGGTGGSGGGRVAWNVGSTSAGGSATSGQGNAGGGIAVSGAQRGGGGGGGAGVAGTGANLATNGGGQGGNGSTAYSDWGLATGTGQNVSGTVYYAGGGAGNAGGVSPVVGGLGGGGTHIYNALPAQSGTASTGGGGAGGLYDPSLTSIGGAGGSGVVIIRYLKA